jgi:hypothetical protein
MDDMTQAEYDDEFVAMVTDTHNYLAGESGQARDSEIALAAMFATHELLSDIGQL